MKQPCPGLTMLRTPEGWAVPRLHYSADPDLTPEKIAKLRSKYTTEAYWNREMEIRADALSGQRVYPEFDPVVHVILDSKVPFRGCRYMAIDPHPRTPHAFLWILIDNWGDWYAYREAWPSKMYGRPGRIRDDEQDNEYTTREYCELLARLEGNEIEWHHAEEDTEYGIYRERHRGEKLAERFMDQAGKGFKVSAEGEDLETYATRYSKFGIDCSDPKKSHHVGEDAVRQLLRVRNHEIHGKWPRLHIAESCPETILELRNHRYKITKTPSQERDLKQDRSEFRCHMVDLLRYLATSEANYIPSLIS